MFVLLQGGTLCLEQLQHQQQQQQQQGGFALCSPTVYNANCIEDDAEDSDYDYDDDHKICDGSESRVGGANNAPINSTYLTS